MINRSFQDFESLHLCLIKKFTTTPYLPCKVVLSLKPEEREQRKVFMQTYMRLGFKHLDIFNSFEFRSFMDIRRRLLHLKTSTSHFHFCHLNLEQVDKFI